MPPADAVRRRLRRRLGGRGAQQVGHQPFGEAAEHTEHSDPHPVAPSSEPSVLSSPENFSSTLTTGSPIIEPVQISRIIAPAVAPISTRIAPIALFITDR